MHTAFRAALASLLLLGVAHAALAETDPSAPCRALLQSVGMTQGPPMTVERLGSDGCRFTGVRFGFGTRFGYRVGVLTERGIPFGPLAVPTRPVSIRVEAWDVAFALHSGQPRADWLNSQQQVPFDVVLDGQYDPGARTLRLGELSMEGRAVGRTSVAADVVHIDAGDLPGPAGLQSLSLHLDSRRFIAGFLLALLVQQLPENDPGGAMQAAKAKAVAIVRSVLPQSGAAPGTVDAIAAFIADFPHPEHVFDLDVVAAKPVTGADVESAGNDPSGVIALLQRLKITASYAGDAR